jgi:putative chitinase
LEKALDKTFNEQQKKAVESIQQALTELDIREQRFIAYIYATAWHESKLKPVKERRAKLNTRLRTLQDRYWESGYYGRGFVQITWEHNYAKFADLLNIHLLEEPDLALQADIAAKILCLGMRDGLFTGLKLSHFFNDERTDWIKARRIVNGDDQAERIAQYGEHIFNALESGNDDEAM